MSKTTITDLDAEYVRRIFDYSPETGIFIWRECDKKHPYNLGRPAGSVGSTGHMKIKIGGRHYLAHRLAWLYVYGVWPTAEIDHINLIADDNRLCNLREATRSQNAANLRRHKDGTSGYKGVSYRAHRGTYEARIRKNGKLKSLGHYKTGKEANEVYLKAAQAAFGEFARGD